MNFPFPALVQKPEQQFRLGQGFTAGKGRPPAGIIIKYPVLFDFSHQPKDHPIHLFCLNFSGHLLAFRVMAPGATQGAPLKKEGGPDAGTVMNGISLNFKNWVVLHHSIFFSIKALNFATCSSAILLAVPGTLCSTAAAITHKSLKLSWSKASLQGRY